MWALCCCKPKYYAVAACNSSGGFDWKATAFGDTSGATTAVGAGNIRNGFVDSSDNAYLMADEDENGSGDRVNGQFLHKMNSSGVRQWTVNLDDDNPTGTSLAGGPFLGSFYGYIVDSSGNGYVVWSDTSGSPDNQWLLKYNSSGTHQWTIDIHDTLQNGAGTTTEKQSIDLSPLTQQNCGSIQLNGTNVVLWMGSSGNYWHGVEFDSSGSFVRTYTAVDVTSSPTQSDVVTTSNDMGRLESGGAFYVGSRSLKTVYKNDADELLVWQKTYSTTQEYPLSNEEGATILESSSGDLWTSDSNGYVIKDAADGSQSTETTHGDPLFGQFNSSGNIMHATTPGDNREIQTDGTTVRTWGWSGNAIFIREMSSNAALIGGSAIEI